MKKLVTSAVSVLLLGCGHHLTPCGDPDSIDQGLTCSLVSAIGSGTAEDVRLHLARGDDPNCQECSELLTNGEVHVGWGWTPLMVAAMVGNVEMIQLLIEHGANINTETSGHQNALTYAMESGHDEAARLLREAGAFVPKGYPGPPPERVQVERLP